MPSTELLTGTRSCPPCPPSTRAEWPHLRAAPSPSDTAGRRIFSSLAACRIRRHCRRRRTAPGLLPLAQVYLKRVRSRQQNVGSKSASVNHLRPPVGVKNAGMPLPAARILSAKVPWGHSSTAILPVRYCFSNFLFDPKNDMIMRSTWPASVRRASPPRPSAPALLETAVSEWRDSGPRFRSAAISVASAVSATLVLSQRLETAKQLNSQATPQRPNPELKMTEPLLTSATASSALSHTFEPPRWTAGTAADLQCLECEKVRKPLAFNLIPVVVALIGLNLAAAAPPAASNCREHACRAIAGADCLTARATPAILSVQKSRRSHNNKELAQLGSSKESKSRFLDPQRSATLSPQGFPPRFLFCSRKSAPRRRHRGARPNLPAPDFGPGTAFPFPQRRPQSTSPVLQNLGFSGPHGATCNLDLRGGG